MNKKYVLYFPEPMRYYKEMYQGIIELSYGIEDVRFFDNIEDLEKYLDDVKPDLKDMNINYAEAIELYEL